MTRLEDRQILKRDIAQARADGSRLAPACALAGLDPRTLQRWKTGDGLSVSDRRPDADRPVPSHALSEAEQARIIAVANEPRFSETPPGAFGHECAAHDESSTRWRCRYPHQPAPGRSAPGDEVILLLLDINMPGISGLDLLPKIKGSKPRLPVFVISVYGDADTVSTARKRGADQFLTKPMDFVELRRDIMAVQADAMRRDA